MVWLNFFAVIASDLKINFCQKIMKQSSILLLFFQLFLSTILPSLAYSQYDYVSVGLEAGTTLDQWQSLSLRYDHHFTTSHVVGLELVTSRQKPYDFRRDYSGYTGIEPGILEYDQQMSAPFVARIHYRFFPLNSFFIDFEAGGGFAKETLFADRDYREVNYRGTMTPLPAVYFDYQIPSMVGQLGFSSGFTLHSKAGFFMDLIGGYRWVAYQVTLPVRPQAFITYNLDDNRTAFYRPYFLSKSNSYFHLGLRFGWRVYHKFV